MPLRRNETASSSSRPRRNWRGCVMKSIARRAHKILIFKVSAGSTRSQISCTRDLCDFRSPSLPRDGLLDLENRNQSLEGIKGSLEKEVQEKSGLVDECMERIRKLELVLSKTQQESTTHRESEDRLEKELEAVKQNLLDKETLVESMRQELERSTSALNEELRRSKETIEAMKRESLSEKDTLLLEYRQTIEMKDRLIKEKIEELENKSKRLLEQQTAALEGLKTENVNRIRELSESFEEQLRAKDTKIEEFSQQLGQKVSETERLLAELAAERELCKKKDEELMNALRKLEGLFHKNENRKVQLRKFG